MYEKLYVMRRERQLKQREVAEKIGIHAQSYHLKESGKRDFTLTEAKRLSRLFGCTLNDLFEDDEFVESQPTDVDTKDKETIKRVSSKLGELSKTLDNIIK